MQKISSATVRADFNDPVAVLHYTRAAHFLGLWESERLMISRVFEEKTARLLEAGCGGGRVTVGLWEMGFRKIVAFDFAEELLSQARSLAEDRGVKGIKFLHADATKLGRSLGKRGTQPRHFDGALFMFNGLMQIPGRENRRAALSQINQQLKSGAPFLFTTHDRNSSPREISLWQIEAEKWAKGEQDPRLVEFGDRYFEDLYGRTFMHLPDRAEILEDLAATGWTHVCDALRCELARESRPVLEFSDECRFWVARKN
ncbi:MAG TPA: class I SAM-dependent methyltransferase [Opitutaceae bacterium]|nr:class I SAM-dependent methyltransferase [Opitutaceae bacterium]